MIFIEVVLEERGVEREKVRKSARERDREGEGVRGREDESGNKNGRREGKRDKYANTRRST